MHHLQLVPFFVWKLEVSIALFLKSGTSSYIYLCISLDIRKKDKLINYNVSQWWCTLNKWYIFCMIKNHFRIIWKTCILEMTFRFSYSLTCYLLLQAQVSKLVIGYQWNITKSQHGNSTDKDTIFSMNMRWLQAVNCRIYSCDSWTELQTLHQWPGCSKSVSSFWHSLSGSITINKWMAVLLPCFWLADHKSQCRL